MAFEHSFWYDCGPSISGTKWHLNPSLLLWLTVNRPDFLMIGGPWSSLTGIGASLFARSRKKLCWAEGNSRSPGNVGAAAMWIKGSLLNRFDIFAVPGIEGEKLARMVIGEARTRPSIVMLPNLVDETRFIGAREFRLSTLAKMRDRLGVGAGERFALWPARLLPYKGIPEALKLLDPAFLAGWKIAILGDGPLRASVSDLIQVLGLGEFVSLHSSIGYEDMPAAYACADLFMLPSLQDPNPLSVVEALHSGLPILISNRVGNFPEALSGGLNGWAFDPEDSASARDAFASAFTCPGEKLQEMGRASKRIASDCWSTDRAIDSFLDAIPVE
jgi:glycosyltransferase involved in cell wall biosynthesis